MPELRREMLAANKTDPSNKAETQLDMKCRNFTNCAVINNLSVKAMLIAFCLCFTANIKCLKSARVREVVIWTTVHQIASVSSHIVTMAAPSQRRHLIALVDKFKELRT